tara:strand:+ start:520 stop:633 length:114 start_codon:yes stop_codon:yes gene_type:complete
LVKVLKGFKIKYEKFFSKELVDLMFSSFDLGEFTTGP